MESDRVLRDPRRQCKLTIKFYNQIADATDIPPMFQPQPDLCNLTTESVDKNKMRSSPPLLKLNPVSARPPTQSFRLHNISTTPSIQSSTNTYERGFHGRTAHIASFHLGNHECHHPKMDLLLWKLLTTPLGRVLHQKLIRLPHRNNKNSATKNPPIINTLF